MVDAGASLGVDASREEPRFHYRCDARWSRLDQGAVVEKHGNVNWFCSRQIELETTEPIEILEDNSRLMAEFTQWALDVGGVRLHVRVDVEWANLIRNGWREGEIENVVYPEVFGRSARRTMDRRVKRETDLIFATERILRVHFRYLDRVDRVAAIDVMIDRTHVPICAKFWGCDD